MLNATGVVSMSEYLVNESKLLKMLAFLAELPEEKWFFGDVIDQEEDGCGTVCCAIGWSPLIFPEEAKWTIGKFGGNVNDEGYDETGSHIYGMSELVAEHLFSPGTRRHIHTELPALRPSCTVEEFTAHIAQFIELVRDGKIPEHSLSEPIKST